MRLLNERHYKPNGSLKNSAYSVKDIREIGVSVVRLDAVDQKEFEAIAEDIRGLAGAGSIKGVLLSSVAAVRNLVRDNGNRALCVKDDPVADEQGVRDNPAHAIMLATTEIDHAEALELRDKLVTLAGQSLPIAALWGADEAGPAIA